MKIVQLIIAVLILSALSVSSQAEKKKTYWVSGIDSTIFVDYYIIELTAADSLECVKFLASPKSFKSNINYEDYRKIEIFLFLELELKINDSLKTERYSYLSRFGGNIKFNTPDSLDPYMKGFPPCWELIWMSGYFTDKVYVADGIKGLYVRRDLLSGQKHR